MYPITQEVVGGVGLRKSYASLHGQKRELEIWTKTLTFLRMILISNMGKSHKNRKALSPSIIKNNENKYFT